MKLFKVRRRVNDSLMSHRKEIIAVGLAEESSLSSARIFDHLSPRMQAVLYQAKKVKELHCLFTKRHGNEIWISVSPQF